MSRNPSEHSLSTINSLPMFSHEPPQNIPNHKIVRLLQEREERRRRKGDIAILERMGVDEVLSTGEEEDEDRGEGPEEVDMPE